MSNTGEVPELESEPSHESEGEVTVQTPTNIVKMSSFDIEEGAAKAYVKCPRFDGKHKHYRRWYKQWYSFLSQTGCGIFVCLGYNNPKLLTVTEREAAGEQLKTETDPDKLAELQKQLRYCLKNDKSFGALLSAIDTSDPKGRFLYDLVASYQTPEFPGGQFELAWAKVKEYFETKTSIKIITYEEKYYKYEFLDCKHFHPAKHIRKFNDKRVIMNANIDESRKVTDKQFIQHVLAKLPKSDTPDTLSPYQQHRSIINQ
jgi:hypothetical protein